MCDIYMPRRANLRRWLQDAPPYVLDCVDDKKEGDRFTVLLVPQDKRSYADTWIPYVGSDEYGNHYSGELRAHDAAGYRYRNGKKRVRWLDLPEPVRRAVVAWMESE